jgi:hypothetical protein
MIIRVIKHVGNMCIAKGNAFGDGVIAKGLDLMICKRSTFGYIEAPTRGS